MSEKKIGAKEQQLRDMRASKMERPAAAAKPSGKKQPAKKRGTKR